MKVTITTHNGHSIAYKHNIRDRSVTDKEKHINPNGWHYSNAVTEREAYKKIFGKAQARYNEAQKREERKIQDYYNLVKGDNRKHTAYEMIVGVYPADGEKLSDEMQYKILSEYIKEFQKNNPNLVVFGYHFHFDESSPHLHVDYIPVGHGFKRGMDTQVSLTKALAEQGFITNGRNTAQIKWEHAENARLENICCRYGLTVEHPQRGKEVKHMSSEIYKKMKELEALEQEVDELQGKAVTLKKLIDFYEKNTGVFQALEDQYNPSTGKTSLEAFCEKKNIDYSLIITAEDLRPNPQRHGYPEDPVLQFEPEEDFDFERE